MNRLLILIVLFLFACNSEPRITNIAEAKRFLSDNKWHDSKAFFKTLDGESHIAGSSITFTESQVESNGNLYSYDIKQKSGADSISDKPYFEITWFDNYLKETVFFYLFENGGGLLNSSRWKLTCLDNVGKPVSRIALDNVNQISEEYGNSEVDSNTTPINKTPILEWQIKTDEIVSSQICFHNQKIIVCANNIVYCLDVDSGKELWKYTAEARILWNAKILNTSMIFADYNGIMYSINVNSGNEIYKYNTNLSIQSEPQILGDSIAIFYEYNSGVCALRIPKGNIKWSASKTNLMLKPYLFDLQTEDSIPKIAYYYVAKNKLSIVNALNGAMLDTVILSQDINNTNTTYGIHPKSLPTDVGDRIYFGCSEQLYWMDLKERFSNKIRHREIYIATTPYVKEDYSIIVYGLGYNYYAYKEINGSLQNIWKKSIDVFSGDGQANAMPVAIDSLIIIGSAQNISAYNINTGKEAWQYEIFNCKINISPIIVGKRLIFCDDKKNIYSLRLN